LLLGELPEAQDLLAVLDVLASTAQSLSLARALKSPLFDVSDNELLWLSQRAREQGGWWGALMRVDLLGPASLQRAAALFASWHRVAATLPPHDLLDRIVHESDWLARLAAVTPPERHARAMDASRALLAAALELDGGRYASPYGFVRALKRRRVMAASVAQGDAVRLLTIHGAKGLEARVLLLMDADPAPRPAESATLLIDWPVHAAHPQRVAFVATEARCPPSLQGLLAVERAARSREEVNALYVALTRAEERVIVSRTPPRSGEEGSWWARLLPLAAPWVAPDEGSAAPAPVQARFVALPLHPRARPSAPVSATDDRAARLGQAVHRTLEWAASRTEADLARLASAAAAEFALSPAQHGEVAAIAARILASPVCRRFFDPASIAWAGAEVPMASANGQVRRLDRLVKLTDGTWWVLDYKLAGAPQDDPALIEQLAGYRAAVERLVPGESVRAAFVTAAGELIES
jgi:ATP-dependent helicase/nuclease subunit A